MNKYFIVIIIVLLLGYFSHGTGHAYTINYDNKTYKFETVGGSFSDNMATLQNNPWWGDGSIAADFAELYRLENSNDDAHVMQPAFAYNTYNQNSIENDDTVEYRMETWNGDDTEGLPAYYPEDEEKDIWYEHVDFKWAVGSPVPEPATMILFGLGLLGLAGVNRRKQ